jgi:hypothetical protein
MGGTGDVKADRAIERLAKFIPAEALSLYMALAGIAASTTIEDVAKPYWLAGLLVVSIVFNVLYLRRFWRVTRPSQIGVSSAALLVYALATGGPLIQSVPYYSPAAAAIALAIVTAFLAFFEPPEPLTNVTSPA